MISFDVLCKIKNKSKNQSLSLPSKLIVPYFNLLLKQRMIYFGHCGIYIISL